MNPAFPDWHYPWQETVNKPSWPAGWQGSRLDLQAEISSLLPELGPARGIRLVNLMSHTGGYHGLDITDMTVRWNSKWDSFAARFRERSQLFPPGMTFNYEHSEHVVLGEALRRLFGQSPSRLVTDTLLAPIGVAPQAASASDATVTSHAYSVQKGAYVPARKCHVRPASVL